MEDEISPLPADLDHFSLFGFEKRLRLDPKEIESVFLKLSRTYHPDRHAAAGPEVRAVVQRNAARVNDAARVLGDRVARAEYLLELEGVARPEGEAKCPPDLLTEIFDLREQLSERADPALADRSRTLLEDAEAKIDALFAEHDAAGAPDERRAVLERIREALDRRKFLSNLAREVSETLGTK